MKIVPSCFPCVLRRILSTAGRITDDDWLHQKLLGKAMTELAALDRDTTPAEMVHSMQTLLSKTLGAADPYQKEREDWFQELEGLEERIGARVDAADDPLECALLLAARANVFDDECLSQRAVREELKRLGLREGAPEPCEGFAFSDLDLFLKDIEDHRTLLFFHDSGPEVPFDRVLIERILAASGSLEVTCVVRSHPVLLDAVREDLERVGIPEIPGVVRTVDPGISALGVPLNECSREFREVFDRSEVILAKGQAHLETLVDCGRPAYFLLRVKCAVVEKAQGAQIGDLLFLKP
ncbi:MAG: DUF89 domain-containing protein [Planctomycetota bacterium]